MATQDIAMGDMAVMGGISGIIGDYGAAGAAAWASAGITQKVSH